MLNSCIENFWNNWNTFEFMDFDVAAIVVDTTVAGGVAATTKTATAATATIF